jgi:hypothetical protein
LPHQRDQQTVAETILRIASWMAAHTLDRLSV